MKRKSLLLLLVLIIGLYSNGQPPVKYSAQAVKEDFEYLYKTLKESHYNLFVNTEKDVFDKEYNERFHAINDSMTLLQINRLFQPFTALSKLEHCTFELPISSYISYLQSGGTLFPLNIYFEDNRLFVLNNYSSGTSIMPSEEIISINRKPVKEIMKGIYDYCSGENDYVKNTYVDGIYNFPRVYWMVYDRCDTFSLEIRRKNGDILIKKLNAISGGEFESKVAQKKPTLNSNREFRFIGSIAYLHPGGFLNAKYTNIIEQGAHNNNEFCQFIDSTFNKIIKNKAKDLIIDLRGNPGGDNTFSDYMISFFATKEFCFNSKFLVKTSQITKDFWKDVNDSSLQILKHDILSKENGTCFEAKTTKVKPQNDLLRFNGRVYVLINRYSYSNAPLTAAIIQDYQFGKLIGEETADTPTTYGAAQQFKLPNTQFIVSYPKGFIIRPNGDSELHGVKPDYRIEDNLLTDNDEILEYTLDLIKKEKNTSR